MSADGFEKINLGGEDDLGMTFQAARDYIDERGGVEALDAGEANRLREVLEAQMDPETLEAAGRIEELVREKAPILAEQLGISIGEAAIIVKEELLNVARALMKEEE